MKLNKFVLLLTSLLLASCNTPSNSESTAVSNDSSTSFVENENVIKEIVPNADLNKLNGYEGLTPSTGNIDILLIPIHFENVKSEMDLSLIDKAFNSYEKNDNTTEFYSVKEYYEISSYGNLNLNFNITETFTPSKSSSYYVSEYNNVNYTYAAEEIMIEALRHLDNQIDFNDYDSNKDGYIDGIYMIYDQNVDYSYKYNLWWAWTCYFQNAESNQIDDYKFDNLKLQSYVFAGYDFLTDSDKKCETHTYIHETAHMFGIDDYYDYNTSQGSNKGGLAKADMMDGTIGDHNAFTKALLGWNTGKLITPKTSITVDLEAFSTNGEYLIITNDFDENKGILQEYFILEYYTVSGLNEFDKMFTIDGIRVLYIIAETKKDGTFKYNNSSTNIKLISQITTSKGNTYLTSSTDKSDDTLFIENESLDTAKFSDDSYLKYTFTVDALTDEKATITISKR